MGNFNRINTKINQLSAFRLTFKLREELFLNYSKKIKTNEFNVFFSILRQAGQAWQRLTEEQKKPYLEKQHAQQSEYDKAMEIYRYFNVVIRKQQVCYSF